ncbi:RodZ domain-containing protein [Sedimenticola sp.]|uniref:RodZ domain-containing protein n=1 Tax=Sedimenticola sp. TaxID=1940285 RepID=UPI003D09D705
MSAADQNEEALETVVEGPGKQLRDIRLAKEMDIHRVANLLHLNTGLLEALEADDYSKLPGTVFVQGYLRNYARLLDIPVDPILEAFQQYRPKNDEGTDLKAAQIRREVRSSHTVIRLITWLIVIGLIALVVTWWRGYLQWPVNLGLDSGVPMSQSESQSALPRVEGGPDNSPDTASQPAPLDKPEILDAPATVESEAAAEPPVTEASAPAESTEQETVVEQPTAPEPEVAPVPMTDDADPTGSDVTDSVSDVAPANESAAGEASQVAAETAIQVSFSDVCWTDISDASGNYRLIGNKAAGDRIVLAGEAPYKMVFGNASAVTVLVNGVPYDLTPHIRGNVAKFTLKPE